MSAVLRRVLFPESLLNPILSSFHLRDCCCDHVSVYCVVPCYETGLWSVLADNLHTLQWLLELTTD